MQALTNTIKMSDLRKNTDVVINSIQNSQSAFMLMSRSEPVLVMMSLSAYRKINQEDLDYFDPEIYDKAIDFFANFSSRNSMKGKKIDAVKLIRNDRD